MWQGGRLEVLSGKKTYRSVCVWIVKYYWISFVERVSPRNGIARAYGRSVFKF